jgi:hypothetical protein
MATDERKMLKVAILINRREIAQKRVDQLMQDIETLVKEIESIDEQLGKTPPLIEKSDILSAAEQLESFDNDADHEALWARIRAKKQELDAQA